MSRWPALLRDPVFFFLAAAMVYLGCQALSWAIVPMSGILAGGFLAGVALVLRSCRSTLGLWMGIAGVFVTLLLATTHTTALLVLSLAGASGMALAAMMLPVATRTPGIAATTPDERPIPNPLFNTFNDNELIAFEESEFDEAKFEDFEEVENKESEGEASGELLQQWERRRLPTGEESVETTLKLAFAAGERSQTLHLPLHPPMSGIEQVHCEVLDGADLAYDVDAIRAFGIRVVLRRRGSCQQPLESYLWITVSTRHTSCKAA